MRLNLSCRQAALCVLCVFPAIAAAGAQAGCSESARLLSFACHFDLQDEFLIATAQCQDNSSVDPACLEDAADDLAEGVEECDDVLEARLDLCESLDDATHEPEFGEDFADNFVDPREIGGAVTPNPYFPLVAGNRWVYEGGDEVVTVIVTDKIKLIDGIECVVVNDVVAEDGDVIENTDDWYAQDLTGNIWYCGEIAENFEYFDGDDPENAELVDIEGSWKSGQGGGLAGILLPFAPTVGDVFRQEVLYTDAEDAVEILSLTATESAPGGSCTENCLQTRDFTPLEPDTNEHKFYAPGIGLILELDPDTGERVELTEFTGAGS